MSDDFRQSGGSPWGTPPGGGGNGSGKGPTPPDIEKIIREFQEKIKKLEAVKNNLDHTDEELIEFASVIYNFPKSDFKNFKSFLGEEGIDIDQEFYLAVTLDRSKAQYIVMASSEGGMEIEEVAKSMPEKIIKVWIDPLVGMKAFHAQKKFLLCDTFLA